MKVPFKHKLAAWVQAQVHQYNDWTEEQADAPDAMHYMNTDQSVPKKRSVVEDRSLSGANINFKIYPAESGHIVEFSKYDRNADRHCTRLHLITDSQDFGQTVAHIITLETMRG
jgi:hypothetical protein